MKAYKVFHIISITLYCASFFFPAFGDTSGVFAVVLGLLTFPSVEFFIWLANPLIWFSWISFDKPTRALYASAGAVILASLFTVAKIPDIGWCGSFLEPEPCGPILFKDLGVGYFLWFGSALVLTVGNIYRNHLQNGND